MNSVRSANRQDLNLGTLGVAQPQPRGHESSHMRVLLEEECTTDSTDGEECCCGPSGPFVKSVLSVVTIPRSAYSAVSNSYE